MVNIEIDTGSGDSGTVSQSSCSHISLQLTMVNTFKINRGSAGSGLLSLRSCNHISLLCKDLEESKFFYKEILGFIPVERPKSLDFEGAWMFNYGISIHLLKAETSDSLPSKPRDIKPRDNHISFQCDDIKAAKEKLHGEGTKYKHIDPAELDGKGIKEGNISVEQLFFHDPAGYMIELCTCENFPLKFLSQSEEKCE